MTFTVEAIYENGVLKPKEPLPFKEHETVRITVAPYQPSEETRGARLIRTAAESHADVVAGWKKFLEGFGIQGQPIGAKKLRALLLEDGMNPDDNEFSRDLIAMREE